MYNAGIIGMGIYMPEIIRKNDFWNGLKIVGYNKDVSNLFIGIDERRIFPEHMHSSDGELIAAKNAIQDANLNPEDIDLVIVNSMLPDHLTPGNATLIQHKLGLKNAGAWNLDTFCSSFVTMIIVASNLVMCGTFKNILLVTSSHYSKIATPYHYLTPAMGDGVGSAIIGRVSSENGFISSFCHANGEYHNSFAINYSHKSSKRELQVVDEELSRSTKNEIQIVTEVVNKTLKKPNLNISDIDMFISHQPFHWIPFAWQEALGISQSKSHLTYYKYGNIASASVPVNLYEARKLGKIKEKSLVLLYSPGAGMNHSCALLQWGE